jgi:hypothetical protein
MNPNEYSNPKAKNPNQNPDPNFQQNAPQNDPTQRAIHRAYGARTPEAMTTNPSHQPHECCGRIFPDKEAFNNHFAAVHVPYVKDENGKQVENPSYVAPENANPSGTGHTGLAYAEHRVGGEEAPGFSTGLKATEKRIPFPRSGNPLTGAEQVDGRAASNYSNTSGQLGQGDDIGSGQVGGPVGTGQAGTGKAGAGKAGTGKTATEQMDAGQSGSDTHGDLSDMSKADRKEALGDMKKSELQDLAEQHDVSSSGNKTELAAAISKKMNKEDKESAA